MLKSIFALFLLITFISCRPDRKNYAKDPEQPEALQDESASLKGIYSRGGADLVAQLYEELLTSDNRLRRLEYEISELGKAKNDSTAEYIKYDRKVRSYYSSTELYANNIRDTILKMKLKSFIKSNLTAYETSVSRHELLDSIINRNHAAISDYHNVLMITRTLPMMLKYQRDNLPETAPAEKYIQSQEKVLQQEQNLAKF